jgi:hypothetical protein
MNENRKEKIKKKDKDTNFNAKSFSSSKTVRVVALRNRFFYMFYRNASLVFFISLLGFIISLIFLIIFIKQPVAPQYIPLNPDGTYIKLAPLSEPKNDLEVNNFVNAAIKKLYKFDYINYSEQLMEAANFFVPEGWNEYLTAYIDSGNLMFVKENHAVVTVKVLEAPVINRKGLNPQTGIYEWELQTKVEISYFGQDMKNNNSVNKTDILYALIRVKRNSVINNPEGLGISKFILTDKLLVK